MSGHRQTALLLHALADSDRDWMLSQLGADDRATVQAMLAELGELGIPSNSALAELNVHAVTTPTALPRLDGALTSQQLEQLHLTLAQEPAWLLAALLSSQAWPWRETFLSGLEPHRAHAVRCQLRPAVAPQLASRLQARLEELLSNHSSANTVSAVPARRRTLWEVLDSWLR